MVKLGKCQLCNSKTMCNGTYSSFIRRDILAEGYHGIVRCGSVCAREAESRRGCRRLKERNARPAGSTTLP